MELTLRMISRARADNLPPSHDLLQRARDLHHATQRRFVARPPDIAQCQFVDAYVRAYAAWHVYTGEE